MNYNEHGIVLLPFYLKVVTCIFSLETSYRFFLFLFEKPEVRGLKKTRFELSK